MKRNDLKAIEGMTPEMIDKIMELHQQDAESWKEEKTNLINAQNEMSDKLKKFDGVDVDQLKKDITDWQSKYEHDLLQKDKEYAKADLFRGYKFSSKLSRKAAEAEFDSKNFEFKDGSFSGAEQFFEELKKSDPEAFEHEEEQPKPSGGVDLGSGGRTPKMTGVEAAFYALNPDLKK